MILISLLWWYHCIYYSTAKQWCYCYDAASHAMIVLPPPWLLLFRCCCYGTAATSTADSIVPSSLLLLLQTTHQLRCCYTPSNATATIVLPTSSPLRCHRCYNSQLKPSTAVTAILSLLFCRLSLLFYRIPLLCCRCYAVGAMLLLQCCRWCNAVAGAMLSLVQCCRCYAVDAMLPVIPPLPLTLSNNIILLSFYGIII